MINKIPLISNTVSIVHLINNTDEEYPGDLAWYFKILFQEATNRYHPYHNFRHMLHVTWEAYDGCIYHKLSPREFRNVLVAAMFHDFNHSGCSAGSDDLEILHSIHAFEKYMDPIDTEYAGIIISHIKATEYPYVVQEEELSIGSRILRDADMSQVFSGAWIQQILFGLSLEMRVSPEDFLKKQEMFVKRIVEFHSEWGEEKFGDQVPAKVQEVKMYLSFLETPDPRHMEV